MKRLWLVIALLLVLTSPGKTADAPVTSFPDLPSPSVDDVLYIVDDPAGANDSKKVTLANLAAAILATATIPVEHWYDVAGIDNATAGAVLDLPPTNAPTATPDTGSNTQKAVLSFDASTDQSFHFKVRLQTGYSTTDGITTIVRWKATGTSGAAGWCVQLVRVPVGATSDPAFPAQAAGNCVSDTAQGTTLQENEATITAVTCTSCVAGDMIYGRVSRDADASAVTDSLTSPALMIKFGFLYRRSLQ